MTLAVVFSRHYMQLPRSPQRRAGIQLARAFAIVATSAVLSVLAVALSPREMHAQKAPLEFTRQGLLITPLAPGQGADFKLGKKAADALRSAATRLANKKETDVISGGDIRDKLERSGYPTETPLDFRDLMMLGREMRADEYILGEVRKTPAGITIDASLHLMRDRRMRQPLVRATHVDLDKAAEVVAADLANARKQLVYQRRCENSLREGKSTQAVAHGREGAAVYSRGILARTCLVVALRVSHAPATEVLSVAREILAVDSMNAHALDAGATALDSLHLREEAATLWLRLAETDTADLELTQRVVFSMVEGGNSKRAEPLITRVSDAHPEDLGLLRQKWRVQADNRNWAKAVETGERLLTIDSLARGDSSFVLRLAGAYRAADMPYRALETAAKGVRWFPTDARLYTLYATLVRGESEIVVSRGLQLFPKSAELYAINARDLKAKGKLEESLAASKAAVNLDSTISQGQLVVAQTELDLGRPDSALATVRRALSVGEDRALVANWSLSKGNTFFRAANGTKRREDFQLAMRFLVLADSLAPSPQSKFLLGASAFSVTQSALTDAPKAAGVVDSAGQPIAPPKGRPTPAMVALQVEQKARGCELARLGSETLPIARTGLEGGSEIQPDAAKQYLDYLAQLEPFVQKQIAAFCTDVVQEAATASSGGGAPAKP